MGAINTILLVNLLCLVWLPISLRLILRVQLSFVQICGKLKLSVKRVPSKFCISSLYFYN